MKDIYEKNKMMIVSSIVIIVGMIFIPMFFIDTTVSAEKLNVVKNNNEELNILKDIVLNGDDKVSVYISEEDKVEDITLEEYIVGVVSSEMPATFDEEALKAQAIAARTFWASKLQRKCNNAKGADICNTTHCQVYMTKEKRLSLWDEESRDEYWNKINNAVNETKGLVLSYNDELVLYPQYFSTSSGKTESAENTQWGDIPYLKSVDSPGEEIAPKFSSEKEVKKDDFIDLVNKNYGDIKIDKNNLEDDLEVVSRSDAGYVEEIKVGDKVILGSEFRFLVGINSTNFTIDYDEDNITFNNKGYGHGVGMSQWGANVRGKNGESFDEILKHYYTGVEISNLKFK